MKSHNSFNLNKFNFDLKLNSFFIILYFYLTNPDYHNPNKSSQTHDCLITNLHYIFLVIYLDFLDHKYFIITFKNYPSLILPHSFICIHSIISYSLSVPYYILLISHIMVYNLLTLLATSCYIFNNFSTFLYLYIYFFFICLFSFPLLPILSLLLLLPLFFLSS